MKYYLCTLIFILSSCTNNKQFPTNPIEYFGSVTPVSGAEVLVLDSVGVYLPRAFAVRDSMLFVQSMGAKDVFISVNLKDSTHREILRKGNGPNEVQNIAAFTLCDGQKFITVENNKRQLIEIPVCPDSAVKFFPMPKEYGPYISAVAGEEYAILTGCLDSGMYLYYNLKDGSSRFFGEYPVREEYRDFDNRTKSLICISNQLAIRPDHSRFAWVNYNSGVIDINAIRNDSIVNVRRLDFHYHDVAINGKKVTIRRDSKNGFFDVSPGQNYFCVIYSGKSFDKSHADIANCDYLMVFDWDGNPVACYRSAQPLSRIFYDEKNKVVYGVSTDDNAKLYKFEI